jgi:hypothetical protein
MAVNPKVVSNDELSDFDLAYIDIWEHHIDFVLTAIRDWKNESEFYSKLEGKRLETNSEETEETTIHRGCFNELLVGMSEIKTKYVSSPRMLCQCDGEFFVVFHL